MKRCLSLILAILFVTTISQGQAEVRMVAHDLHQERLIVDLQIRSAEIPFILSNHNLRIYFNSHAGAFNSFYSSLPADAYEGVLITELIENSDASSVNALDYDNDLGFINLRANHNTSDGSGIVISEEWIKLGSIVFEGTNDLLELQATWARETKTAGYATAFVEITEWKKDKTTERIEISEFTDLTWQRVDYERHDVELAIGPNPSADFIIISHQWESPTSYQLFSIQGVVLQSGHLPQHQAKIDLSNYTAGTYVVRMKSGDLTYNQIIEKVDFN